MIGPLDKVALKAAFIAFLLTQIILVGVDVAVKLLAS